MAENKNALVNETAIENGNAALTERLEDAAERMAEAQKATAQVAEEQKMRLAEQEQSSELLQKEEEQRKAQAQEAAKSVADRAAAVLDYTENYRQNQKLEKAARSTVSKAKMERLAQEAEAKAKAEREAEEALQREREELMARRQRSSALLKKVENDTEAEAPEAQVPAKAPAAESAPVAPAPKAAVAEEKAPVEEAAPEVLNIFAEEADAQPAAEEDDGIVIVFAEETAEEEKAAEETEKEPVAEQADAAEEEKPLTTAEIVQKDIDRVAAEEKAKRDHAAEIAKTVDEALLRMRLAQMMPEHMIPESLRLPKEEPAAEEEKAAEPNYADLIARLEGAVAAADRSGDARIADVLSRLEEMARRVEEGMKQPAEAEGAAQVEAEAAEGATDGQIAAAAEGDALPEAFGKEPFKRKELRRYLKSTKAEIAAKKKAAKKIKREKGESKKDYQSRRLEAEAALLGTQFAAIALLSYKGHDDAALSFKKDAEAGIARYNKDIEKYNRVSKENCELLPEGLVEQIAKEGKLPETLPFGSAATGLDAATPAGGDAMVEAFAAPEDLAKAKKEDLEKHGASLVRKEKEEREEQKRLRKEMQNEMLMHALLWNPAAAAVINKKAKEKAKENTEGAEMSAEAFRAAANSEERKARREEKRAKRAEKNARRQSELMEGYAAALSGKPKKKEAPTPYGPAPVRTGNGAAVDAFRLAASYDSFLSNEAERKAYYRNRLAMIEAKREEQKLLAKSTRSLPKDARHELAAAQRLDLIKDEINLLCLLHRYPDEKTAAICRKDCAKDIQQYNRHASKLDAKTIHCKPISAVLPSQALRAGMEMPAGAWQQLDNALMKKDDGYKPSKDELRASYARIIAEDEKDREVIAAAAAGLSVAALRKESTASLKARAKVRAAIAKAEEEYERACSERNALLDECTTLASRPKPKEKEIAALAKRIEALDKQATEAKEKKEKLTLAKTAVETSTTLSPKEKAELLSLALSVSEKGGRSADGERFERMTTAAAAAEAKAAAKARKHSHKKEKNWEKSIAATEAEALAAEDTADVALENAERLYGEKGSSRAASDAYEKALLEESKAEGARKVADTVRVHHEDEEQSELAHKNADVAMAALAIWAQSERRGKSAALSEKQSKRIDAAIAAAERKSDSAEQAYEAALENFRNLEANCASAAERENARRQCLKLRAEALAAREKTDALCEAKAVAEDSTTMSKKKKAALLALAVAASAKGSNRAFAKLRRKTSAAAAKEAKVQAVIDKKADRVRARLDKQFASAEAQALVSEGNAQSAREKLAVLREQKRDKKALNKAYKEILTEEAHAEKAKKEAEQAQDARAEQDAKEKKREQKAALLAAAGAGALAGAYGKKKADRKAAKRKAGEKKVDSEQLEAYARACEEKAEQAEKQALLLAVEKGRKKEKMKAYEAAVIARFEATKAREAAKAAEKQSAAAPAPSIDTPITEKKTAEDKASLSAEKSRMKSEAKAERLAAKKEKAEKRLQKRASKDARAWQLLAERDDMLARRAAYIGVLEQDKQDKARMAKQSAAAAPVEAVVEPADSKAEKAAEKQARLSLGKRALKRKQKEFEKQDIKMLTARYDAAIAEEKRALEVRLCDLSVSAPLRKYLKRESAKNVRQLNSRKRLALHMEKADNKRYFSVLYAAILPKNAKKTGTAELIEYKERLLALLTERYEQNERLLAIYAGENGKAGRVKTPWHKAYIKEKQRWHRKSRKTMRKIEQLNISRTERKKLAASLDRVATAHADIAEAKCRARKQNLKGAALRFYKQELAEMQAEVQSAEKNMKRRMKAAQVKDAQRAITRSTIVSLVILAVIAAALIAGWKLFGSSIWAFVNNITAR